jgi:hypothetical protein
MSEGYFGDLENRHAERERHDENTARVAEAFARFQSTGIGSIEFEERINFGLTFTEEPYMSYGTQIDLDDLDDLLGNEAGTTAPMLPVCTGYVTDWDRDDRGFYTGAWVGVNIWFPYESNVWPDIEIEMFHHYTFKAVAMKDVPIDGIED